MRRCERRLKLRGCARFAAMPIIVSLFWSLVLAQAASTVPAAAPAAVVTAETIEATMRQSIANNTLDKKMNETPVKGGDLPGGDRAPSRAGAASAPA